MAGIRNSFDGSKVRSSSKTDVFALGMTALYCATLRDSSELYNY